MDNSVISAWSTGLPSLIRLELLGPFLVHASSWITFFEHHQDLKGFLITQSPRFDLACMEALVTNCKSLEELRLKEIGQIDDDFLPHIAKLGGQLTYLDLSYPGNPEALSNEALIGLMSSVCGGLAHLDLSKNWNVTNELLSEGVKLHAQKLTSLALSNIPELTDAGIAEFFSSWAGTTNTPNPPLTALDLSRNPLLAGSALAAVLEHSGSSLEHLNVNGWKDVPEEELNQIADKAPYLKRLDLGWCRETNDWVVKALLEKCELLEEVKVWGCQRVTHGCPRKVGV
jgi:DNA repair protein RAD7